MSLHKAQSKTTLNPKLSFMTSSWWQNSWQLQIYQTSKRNRNTTLKHHTHTSALPSLMHLTPP